jgi:hypothetical protein
MCTLLLLCFFVETREVKAREGGWQALKHAYFAPVKGSVPRRDSSPSASKQE